MSVTHTVSSNQIVPRHTKVSTYRCFLPDLTGFIDFRCVGPDSQHHLYRPDPTVYGLGEEFDPAVADCRLQGTANSPSSTENGGKSGIRTLGRVAPTHAFQACSLSRSDISPQIILNIVYTSVVQHNQLYY